MSPASQSRALTEQGQAEQQQRPRRRQQVGADEDTAVIRGFLDSETQ